MNRARNAILVLPLCFAVFLGTTLAFGDSTVLCVRADGHVGLESSDDLNRCLPADHDHGEHPDESPPCGDDGGACVDVASTLDECNRPSSPPSDILNPLDSVSPFPAAIGFTATAAVDAAPPSSKTSFASPPRADTHLLRAVVLLI